MDCFGESQLQRQWECWAPFELACVMPLLHRFAVVRSELVSGLVQRRLNLNVLVYVAFRFAVVVALGHVVTQ